jgi:hypothetical protein
MSYMMCLKELHTRRLYQALDWFGDQHLAAVYHNQLKTTQRIGKALQEFATTIERVTHRAFLARHLETG